MLKDKSKYLTNEVITANLNKGKHNGNDAAKDFVQHIRKCA